MVASASSANDEAALSEDSGVDSGGELAELLHGDLHLLGRGGEHLLDILVGVPAEPPFGALQLEGQRDETLLGAVVEIPLDLVFARRPAARPAARASPSPWPAAPEPPHGDCPFSSASRAAAQQPREVRGSSRSVGSCIERGQRLAALLERVTALSMAVRRHVNPTAVDVHELPSLGQPKDDIQGSGRERAGQRVPNPSRRRVLESRTRSPMSACASRERISPKKSASGRAVSPTICHQKTLSCEEPGVRDENTTTLL